MSGKRTGVKSKRAAEIATIHILKKDLKLDDDSYRDLMQSVTGLRSSKDMDHQQRNNFLDHLRNLAEVSKVEVSSKFTRSGLAANAPPDKAALLHKIGRQLETLGKEREYLEHGANGRVSMVRRLAGVDALKFASPEGLHKIVAALEYQIKRQKDKAAA